MSEKQRRLPCRPLRALVAAICSAALAACNVSKNAYVPPPPPSVAVSQPVQQSVTVYFELTGNTAPINSVDLEARVQGFLESIDYKDGASVAKGTQLFGIERDIYQAQLDQAKATLASNQASQAYAQADYQRQLTLSKQDFASQATLQDSKAKYDQATASVLSAQASIEIATINLGYTSVLAPFDGVVTNHLVDVGSLVGVSGPTKLATIMQIDPVYVYFNVSEPQVLMVRENLAKQGRRNLRESDLPNISVEIGLQGEQGYPHKGHLDYVSPQVDSNTGTLSVRALFENKDRALLPGYFVRVRVPIGRRDNALLIPDDAIGTSQEGSYVLVVGKDNVLARKLVKSGERQGRLRIIESGLDPSDWVVTEGVQRAAPGVKVDPRKEAPTVDQPNADKATTTAPTDK